MLRLQGRGMDPVRMEALVDNLGRVHEVGDQFIGDSQVHRCEGFFLIESPDMQFMDGFDAGNRFQIMLDIFRIDSERNTLQQNGSTFPNYIVLEVFRGRTVLHA